MNFSQIGTNEWRRSFSLVFFAVLALSALLIGCFTPNLNPAVQIGLLIITVSFSLLIFFLMVENLRSLVLKNDNQLTGKTDIQLSTFEGEYKAVESITGYIPCHNVSSDINREERVISLELKEIIKNNWSPENCLKGLDFLSKNESVVQKSWTHTLNRARLLRVVGRSDEAESLTYKVIEKFSDINQAVGTAYEVLSWIEEFREPEKKGEAYQQWLINRKLYVMKGLELFPNGYYLLMNAFEIAVLQRDSDSALSYLTRAALIDAELTRANLYVNPLTRKALRLNVPLKTAIFALIGEETKTKIYQLLKKSAFISVLAAGIFITSDERFRDSFHNLSRLKPGVLNIVKTSPVELNTFIPLINFDGTGLGRLVKNISFFRADGTGLGR